MSLLCLEHRLPRPAIPLLDAGEGVHWPTNKTHMREILSCSDFVHASDKMPSVSRIMRRKSGQQVLWEALWQLGHS